MLLQLVNEWLSKLWTAFRLTISYSVAAHFLFCHFCELWGV